MSSVNENQQCLESRASPMSIVFFSWLDTLIWKGFRRPLTQDQLPPSPDTLNVHSNIERYAIVCSNIIGHIFFNENIPELCFYFVIFSLSTEWRKQIKKKGISFKSKTSNEPSNGTLPGKISNNEVSNPIYVS